MDLNLTTVSVAAITAIPATLAAIGSWHNGRKIDRGIRKVDAVAEVTNKTDSRLVTANTMETGELLDAVASRVFGDVPPENRTPAEEAHTASIAATVAQDASSAANFREKRAKGL